MWDLYSKNIKLKNRSYLSQAGTVQISYVLTIYFISQEQNNGGFVHNSLSEKKCTVGKHKNSPAYHKPGSHKGKSPYALIPMVTTWWNPIIHCQDDMGCTFLLFLHIWKKTEKMYSVPFLYSAVLYVAIVQEGVSPWTCTCASRHVHMTSLNNINRTFTGLKGKMKYCGHFNRNIQTHQKYSLIKKTK